MCWTLNHQNIIEIAQRHIFLSSLEGDEESTIKSQAIRATNETLITCLNCGTWRGLEALNVSWNGLLALVLNVCEYNAWVY
jgi:hypothetical protein